MPETIINPSTSTQDGCPALDRLKVFRVDEGVKAKLEADMVDASGSPVDLTYTPPDPLPDDWVEPKVVVRFREESGIAGQAEQTYEVDATIVNQSQGTWQVQIPDEVVQSSGLYRVSAAYLDDAGDPTLITNSLMSVAPSLWGNTAVDAAHICGIPSIDELRVRLMDHPSANQLLGESEFSDEDILVALTRPIQEFNDEPPTLRQIYTTKTFPWRNEWLDATIGYLLQSATHYYRRNRLTVSGGGLTDDKNNREPEYLRAADMMLTHWRTFIGRKKYEINSNAFFGSGW